MSDPFAFMLGAAGGTGSFSLTQSDTNEISSGVAGGEAQSFESFIAQASAASSSADAGIDTEDATIENALSMEEVDGGNDALSPEVAEVLSNLPTNEIVDPELVSAPFAEATSDSQINADQNTADGPLRTLHGRRNGESGTETSEEVELSATPSDAAIDYQLTTNFGSQPSETEVIDVAPIDTDLASESAERSAYDSTLTIDVSAENTSPTAGDQFGDPTESQPVIDALASEEGDLPNSVDFTELETTTQIEPSPARSDVPQSEREAEPGLPQNVSKRTPSESLPPSPVGADAQASSFQTVTSSSENIGAITVDDASESDATRRGPGEILTESSSTLPETIDVDTSGAPDLLGNNAQPFAAAETLGSPAQPNPDATISNSDVVSAHEGLQIENESADVSDDIDASLAVDEVIDQHNITDLSGDVVSVEVDEQPSVSVSAAIDEADRHRLEREAILNTESSDVELASDVTTATSESNLNQDSSPDSDAFGTTIAFEALQLQSRQGNASGVEFELQVDQRSIESDQVAAINASGTSLAAPEIPTEFDGSVSLEELLNGTAEATAVGLVGEAIGEAVESAVTDDKSVYLEVHPQELGFLTIEVSHVEDAVEAKIIASEMVTSELLMSHRDQLVQSLQDLGYDSLDVDISYDQRASSDSQSDQTDHRPSFGQPRMAQQTTPMNTGRTDRPSGLDIVA